MARKYPNQDLICIQKTVINRKDKFVLVEKGIFHDAQRNLDDNGFHLWLYLISQSDTEGKFNWALSGKHFQDLTGQSESRYKRGKQELIRKGYLVLVGKSKYTFYDRIKPVKEMNKQDISSVMSAEIYEQGNLVHIGPDITTSEHTVPVQIEPVTKIKPTRFTVILNQVII